MSTRIATEPIARPAGQERPSTPEVFEHAATVATWDADYYHPLALAHYDRAVAWTLARLNARPGDLVLDAGCGPGVHAIRAAKAGMRVQAIDLARTMLDEARRRAREAGVVYFIDKSLTTFGKDQQPVFAAGLRVLRDHVARKVRGQTRFSALTPAQQDEVLRGIEQTPFFQTMQFATTAGMFALPSYGGNRDYLGWKLMGQDLVQDYKPPFGYYDDPRNRRPASGGAGE